MYLNPSEIVIVFFIFSFLGWCIEVFLKAIQLHRYINRGFLIGPYCPIYGFGVLFILFFIDLFLPFPYRMIEVFIAGFLICGTLEYLVSYMMEKRYHLRWWDYSEKPLNIHGRVWIGNLILFGLSAVFIAEAGYPLCRHVLNMFSTQFKWMLSLLIGCGMFTDACISSSAMRAIRLKVEETTADSTEQIRAHIHATLASHSLPVRHLLKTYPSMFISKEFLKQKLEKVREDFLEKAEEIEADLENNPQTKQLKQKADEIGSRFRNTDQNTKSDKK